MASSAQMLADGSSDNLFLLANLVENTFLIPN